MPIQKEGKREGNTSLVQITQKVDDVQPEVMPCRFKTGIAIFTGPITCF